MKFISHTATFILLLFTMGLTQSVSGQTASSKPLSSVMTLGIMEKGGLNPITDVPVYPSSAKNRLPSGKALPAKATDTKFNAKAYGLNGGQTRMNGEKLPSNSRASLRIISDRRPKSPSVQ